MIEDRRFKISWVTKFYTNFPYFCVLLLHFLLNRTTPSRYSYARTFQLDTVTTLVLIKNYGRFSYSSQRVWVGGVWRDGSTDPTLCLPLCIYIFIKDQDWTIDNLFHGSICLYTLLASFSLFIFSRIESNIL